MTERSIAVVFRTEAFADALRAIDALFVACVSLQGAPDLNLPVSRNHRLGVELAEHANRRIPVHGVQVHVRVWSFEVGDKAATWNGCILDIRPAGRVAHFVDGYTLVRRDALTPLESALHEDVSIWASTGSPLGGGLLRLRRKDRLADGNLQGNLHVIRADVLDGMRADCLRLPVGLYRVDGVARALMCFGLDPTPNEWESARTRGVPGCRRMLIQRACLHLAELRVGVRRRLRQAQGRLGNAAVRSDLALRKRSPSSWPSTVERLVLDWVADNPRELRKLLWRHPLCGMVLRRLRERSQRDGILVVAAPSN